MEIIKTTRILRERLKDEPAIAFVPTMGNLHEGHIQLAKVAKEQGSCVVVSIYVNPLQFGPNEDFASYPRTLEQDCAKLESVGVDVVFAPLDTEMYPDFNAETRSTGQTMIVTPPPVASQLCGASRPGHFDGVATVVLKLFNLVKPQVAVFGKKDFQQLFIIRELVRQMNLDITILGVDTVREESGLAMSSRNGYLSAAEKQEASRLNKALRQVISTVQKGNHDFAAIEAQTSQYLTQLGWMVDYISIRSATTLLPATASDKALIVLAAAKLGRTRLIDNMEFSLD